MMLGLPGDTWIRLVVWLILGMILYFTYGRYHSRVQALESGVPAPSAPSMAD